MVIFLVRGHTHNRLDAANQKVSGKYYGAKQLETPQSMVTFFSNFYSRVPQVAAIQSIPGSKYSAQLQWPIFDFRSVLKPCIDGVVKKKLKITKVWRRQFGINVRVSPIQNQS